MFEILSDKLIYVITFGLVILSSEIVLNKSKLRNSFGTVYTILAIDAKLYKRGVGLYMLFA